MRDVDPGRRDATCHTAWHATNEMGGVDLSISDLQRVHLHHLRHGPAGVAADVETLAGLRGVTVTAVVRAIEEAFRSPDAELARWAGVVAPYVRAAIAAGELTER